MLQPFAGQALCWSRGLIPEVWNLPFYHADADTQDMLLNLSSFLEPMVFPAHTTMIRANTVGTNMYCVQSGRCKVVVDGLVRGAAPPPLKTRTSGLARGAASCF
jgi:hypothetical protein